MALFNIGKDQVVSFTNPLTGAPITWGNITDFHSKPVSAFLISKPISLPQQVMTTYDGWDGDFTIDRIDATTDDYFAAGEDAFWGGAVIADATIMETIRDSTTGAVHQYQYQGVALKLDDAGSKKSNDRIVMKVSFACQRRIKLS